MWLASADRGENPLPASMRPDRSKVMIEMGGPEGTNLVLHVDPGRPRAWRENANIMTLVNAFLRGNQQVFVVTGDRRSMLTPPQEASKPKHSSLPALSLSVIRHLWHTTARVTQ